MKKIILTILFANCVTLYSQTEWTELTYHYQTGSVPPPYFYSYNINLNVSGKGQLVYFSSYSMDSSWVYDLNINDSVMNVLNEALKKSNIFTDSIIALSENRHPIGGSMQNVKIVLKQDSNLDQMPKTIVVPYFSEKEFKEGLEKLYKTIKEIVPQNLWDDIQSRKENQKNK
jgi:hypothetical protein